MNVAVAQPPSNQKRDSSFRLKFSFHPALSQIAVLLLPICACSSIGGIFEGHKNPPQCRPQPTCAAHTAPLGKNVVPPHAVVVNGGNYVPPPPKLSFDDDFAPAPALLPGRVAGDKKNSSNQKLNIKTSPREGVTQNSLLSARPAGPISGDEKIDLLLGEINAPIEQSRHIHDRKSDPTQTHTTTGSNGGTHQPENETKSQDRPAGFDPISDTQ